MKFKLQQIKIQHFQRNFSFKPQMSFDSSLIFFIVNEIVFDSMLHRFNKLLRKKEGLRQGKKALKKKYLNGTWTVNDIVQYQKPSTTM